MNALTSQARHDQLPAWPAPSRAPGGGGIGWLRVIGLWLERARQRRALAGLSDWLLADVGITRAEAAREIAKPFWR